MKISADKINIELSNEESDKIAYHIYYSLKASILSHYISTGHDNYKRGLDGHAKPLFEEQCRKDLDLMNSLMSCAGGDSEKRLENDLWDFLEKSYNEKNTK